MELLDLKMEYYSYYGITIAKVQLFNYYDWLLINDLLLLKNNIYL